MDKNSTNNDLISGTKPIPLVCQEYQALLKINSITEKEIAEMFIKAFGVNNAAIHISNNFPGKVAKSILITLQVI